MNSNFNAESSFGLLAWVWLFASCKGTLCITNSSLHLCMDPSVRIIPAQNVLQDYLSSTLTPYMELLVGLHKPLHNLWWSSWSGIAFFWWLSGCLCSAELPSCRGTRVCGHPGPFLHGVTSLENTGNSQTSIPAEVSHGSSSTMSSSREPPFLITLTNWPSSTFNTNHSP